MYALLLPLLAAAAFQSQPGVAVTNSPPPPIVSVRDAPATPRYIAPPPTIVPMPPAVRPVRPPQVRLPAQALISIDDYPGSAIRNGEQGRVGFLLDVGANGRVLGCTITRSSGSPILDATSCRIMRVRGRFTPAIDSNGNPVAGRVSDEIVWTLSPWR